MKNSYTKVSSRSSRLSFEPKSRRLVSSHTFTWGRQQLEQQQLVGGLVQHPTNRTPTPTHQHSLTYTLLQPHLHTHTRICTHSCNHTHTHGTLLHSWASHHHYEHVQPCCFSLRAKSNSAESSLKLQLEVSTSFVGALNVNLHQICKNRCYVC